ncbi:MAG: hypothetical protein A2W17_03550 [Planctomycetes bacterium RBG_16_41_13]|nr:MAG: hypothetical protein A2W17_03550 [Planctomycetes bacterium RBG_16_41_13]
MIDDPDKIATQKKWFKVWTTLLMDTYISNNEIGMFTRLGCAIAFRGINGKLVTTNQALQQLLQIPTNENIPQSFIDNFNVQIHQNGNDKISVTFKNWYKLQVDNSVDRVAKHRLNVTRNVTMQDKIRIDKKRLDKIREDKIKINGEVTVKEPFLYATIISYLNEKAKTSYKATTKKTTELIKARLKEGFALEDFKKVIDNKVHEWLNDLKFRKFLRPETLFGTKFEGYLNQQPLEKTQYDIDMEELEKNDKNME